MINKTLKANSKSPIRKKSKNSKQKKENGIKIRGIENKPMLLNLLTNCTKNLKLKNYEGREESLLTDRTKYKKKNSQK